MLEAISYAIMTRMITKLLSYKLYLYFISTILAVLIGVYIYFSVFTTTWSGIDGGFGAVGMLAYIFMVAILLGASLAMRKFAQRHEKITRNYLIVFWAVVIVAVIAGIGVTIFSSKQEATHAKVERAFERCGISEVRWNYATEPHLVISYVDQSTLAIAEQSDPQFVSSMVSKNIMRCGEEYDFYSNGNLTKVY